MSTAIESAANEPFFTFMRWQVYGLGWMLDTVELGGARTPMAGHASRTIEGASTSFLTFPERGLVVAVMANISFADARSIALVVAQIFGAGPL